MAEKANKETVDVEMEVKTNEDTGEETVVAKETFGSKVKGVWKRNKKKIGIGLAIVGSVVGAVFVKNSLGDALDRYDAENSEDDEDSTEDSELEELESLESEADSKEN